MTDIVLIDGQVEIHDYSYGMGDGKIRGLIPDEAQDAFLDKVRYGKAFGEFGNEHLPKSFDTPQDIERYMHVDDSRVCVKIANVAFDEGSIVKIRFDFTGPYGEIAKEIYQKGEGCLAVRCLKIMGKTVEKVETLVTYDFVCNLPTVH